MTGSPPSLPQLTMATTLDRVALAMREIGTMVAEVESCILDDIMSTSTDKTVPPTVQHLDHALQMVDEVAHLLHRLALSQRPDATTNLTEAIFPVGLERLHQLIAFGTLEEKETQHAAGTDGISLF